MKILFIGGNGNISWWCVQKALESGHEVFELNRGMTRKTRRPVQPEVHEIIADIRNEDETRRAIDGLSFDVVCDFICFNEEQARQGIRVFDGKCRQYIVISSEAVYKRKTEYLPFNENTPLYDGDVDDSYIAGKIAVERVFRASSEENRFPFTIVRPGYTYDTIIQMPLGQNCFTAPQRLLEGYPYLIPGDGENLLAPMHSKDFAEAFMALIGEKDAIGETYHIAAEQLVTQNEMAYYILDALGCDPSNVYHLPYMEAINNTDFYSGVVTHQHMWHYIFDDSKIKRIAKDWNQKISFKDGINETVAWLMEDTVRRRINNSCDEKLMNIYAKHGFTGGIN